MPFGLYDPQTPASGLSTNQAVYAKIMGLVPPGVQDEASTVVPGLAQPANPLSGIDPAAYQMKSLLGGQQGDWRGTQEMLIRDAANRPAPQYESGVPDKNLLLKTLGITLLAKLFGDKKGRVGAGALGAVQQASQMGAQAKNKTLSDEFEQEGRRLGAEVQIAGMRAQDAEKRRGELIDEGRHQRSEAARLKKEVDDQVKWQRGQDEIRGRGERSKFFSANSVSELNAILDAFQDPAIAIHAPSTTQIKNKIAEIEQKATEEAGKQKKVEQGRAVDDFNGGYRAAYQAATQTEQGWTKELADVWNKKRFALKQSGLDGNALDPIARPGGKALAKANLDERRKENEFSRRMQEKNYSLREGEVLRKVLSEGDKPVRELETKLETAKRNLKVLQEQAKKSFDLSIDDKIEKEKATIKVLTDEIVRKKKEGPRVGNVVPHSGIRGKLPPSLGAPSSGPSYRRNPKTGAIERVG